VVLLRDCGLPEVAIHLIRVARSDPSRSVRSLAVESLARAQLNRAVSISVRQPASAFSERARGC
jgi:hypothetical protein